MDGARAARHATSEVIDRSGTADLRRKEWTEALVYYHGQGRPPSTRSLGTAFSIMLFLLALVTALALLDQFA